MGLKQHSEHLVPGPETSQDLWKVAGIGKPATLTHHILGPFDGKPSLSEMGRT